MEEHTNHEDFDSSLYHYLKEEVKITITNFQTSRPKTEEYNEIKKRNLSNVIKFLCDKYEAFHWRKSRNEFLIDKDISVTKKADMYSSYKYYCEQNKYTAYNYSSFKSYFKDIKGVVAIRSHGEQCFKFIKDEFVVYIKQFEENDEGDDELLDEED
jgi:hypothetical protein